ncbi:MULTISPECIES: phage holin family protein [Microtetraspora]|uniref:Phage holin family protein n=1 Tax=Microtetraspora glauca TaxID=1996 RepID=A0ABV3GJT2_MICGL|nr:phage holin family protein [Microtetraspora sp. AC03309]MCC5581796.1 phage holin family protein [Microtetraspora sp. AC03309]
MPEDESLGALVAQASTHISTLVRSEIELAKAELKFDAKRVGTATGLFGAAAFIGHLCLILASFTIAYALMAAGLAQWLAFLIVTVFYLVVAGALVFVGYRRLKGLNRMQRTTRTLRNLKGGGGDGETVEGGTARPSLFPETAPARKPYTGPTAGQVGAHRETVSETPSHGG